MIRLTQRLAGGAGTPDATLTLPLEQRLKCRLRVTLDDGTEAGLFQEIGIPTVVCGPGSIEQAHKPDEYVEIDQLDQCLDMLEKLKRKLV